MKTNLYLAILLSLALAGTIQAQQGIPDECEPDIPDNIGDYNFDSYVDISDVVIFALNWLEQDCGLTNPCDGADTSYYDGEVNLGDFVNFAEHWGTCTDPTNPDCTHEPLTLFEPPNMANPLAAPTFAASGIVIDESGDQVAAALGPATRIIDDDHPGPSPVTGIVLEDLELAPLLALGGVLDESGDQVATSLSSAISVVDDDYPESFPIGESLTDLDNDGCLDDFLLLDNCPDIDNPPDEISIRSNSSIKKFSGEFQTAAVDMRIPGKGLDFIWARRYRSRTGSNTKMGNRWNHSYNIYLNCRTKKPLKNKKVENFAIYFSISIKLSKQNSQLLQSFLNYIQTFQNFYK